MSRAKVVVPARVNDVPIIHIHIDKTAGCSIWRALFPDWPSIAGEGGNLRRPFKHATARQWRATIGRVEYDQAFVFSITRNPYDRVVSKYLFSRHVKQEPFGDPLNRLSKKTSFSEWIRRYQEEGKKPLRTQVQYLCDSRGILLTDYVGRFERIEESWEEIKEKIGAQNLGILGNHNGVGRRRPFQEYYENEEDIEIVTAWYQADLEEFGYKFGTEERQKP